MPHKMTVRLSDEAWEGLEVVLAMNNITATAFFEASARFVARSAAQNQGRPYLQWEDQAPAKDHWLEFFELAKAIDVERRSRAPRPD